MNDIILSRRALTRWTLGLFGASILPGVAQAEPSASWRLDAALDAPTSAIAEPLDTPLGKLAGQLIENGDKPIVAYKGIPYALPPTGNRRWKAAEPAPAWNCLRDATSFGPQAVQAAEPETAFFYLPQSIQSEDCLYLNVWTPVLPGSGQSRLPVMVWIHGGAFIGGAGSIPVYDGAALARKDAVVVSINYRVGILGYFAHPELTEEAQGGICANFGTTDQIEALRWVRNNISAFGGDPENVTIFGESAGSMSVSQLMASPLAKGLFHKAIGQSGGFFYAMRSLKHARWGEPSAQDLGQLFGSRIDAPSLSDLRAMPAHQLVAASQKHGDLLNQLGALIAIDGKVFEHSVHETFRLGKQHAVPVLLGFNSDEGSGIADYGGIPAVSDPVAYDLEVRARYANLADDYLKLYPSNDPQAAAFDAYRDQAFGWHMIEWARLMAKVSRPAFLYYFTHTPPGADAMRQVPSGGLHRIGAHHASEIAYVFNNIDQKRMSVWGDGKYHANRPSAPPRPEDYRLADMMSDFWVSFARTGVPYAKGQPQWRPYNHEQGTHMRFGPGAEWRTDIAPGMWELTSRINDARKSSNIFWYFGNVGLNGPALPR